MIIDQVCTDCGEKHTLIVEDSAYERWQAGTPIQDALSSLSDDQRELLLSGMCGECFDELFRAVDGEDIDLDDTGAFSDGYDEEELQDA